MAQAAQQQAVDFDRVSNPLIQDLGSQAFALGSRVTFTTLAGRMGLAEGILLNWAVSVTPTLGTGAAAFSVLRPFANRIAFSQGGKTYREIHPTFYQFRNQITRRRPGLNQVSNTYQGGADVQGIPFYANTGNFQLGGTLNTLTSNSTQQIVYQQFIPFRWKRGLKAGMFPIGDSTRPLVIDLTMPAAAYGQDPEAHPVLVSGNATATITGTVSATLVYRQVLSYGPGVQVAAPVIGTQIRHTMSSVPIVAAGAEVPIPHLNHAVHALHLVLVEDGTANPAAAAGVNGTGLTSSNVSRFRHFLTDQTPVIDLATPRMFQTWQTNNRLQYGLDLPDGVFPVQFGEDDHGTGFYNWVDADTMEQMPDYNVWQNAQTGVTINAGSPLNTAAAGLARLTCFSEWLEPYEY